MAGVSPAVPTTGGVRVAQEYLRGELPGPRELLRREDLLDRRLKRLVLARCLRGVLLRRGGVVEVRPFLPGGGQPLDLLRGEFQLLLEPVLLDVPGERHGERGGHRLVARLRGGDGCQRSGE